MANPFLDSYKPGTKDAYDKDKYPYLGWVGDNFLEQRQAQSATEIIP